MKVRIGNMDLLVSLFRLIFQGQTLDVVDLGIFWYMLVLWFMFVFILILISTTSITVEIRYILVIGQTRGTRNDPFFSDEKSRFAPRLSTVYQYKARFAPYELINMQTVAVLIYDKSMWFILTMHPASISTWKCTKVDDQRFRNEIANLFALILFGGQKNTKMVIS